MWLCLNIRTGCSERLWCLHSWGYLKHDRTQPWETCSSWSCFEGGGKTKRSPQCLASSTVLWFCECVILWMGLSRMSYLPSILPLFCVSHIWNLEEEIYLKCTQQASRTTDIVSSVRKKCRHMDCLPCCSKQSPKCPTSTYLSHLFVQRILSNGYIVEIVLSSCFPFNVTELMLK